MFCSVLKCEEKLLEVVQEPKRCSLELQVYEGTTVAYVKPGTKILQNTFIEKDCDGLDDMGLVYKVFTDEKKNRIAYLIQNQKLNAFTGVTGTVLEHSQLFEDRLEEEDQLQYDDFTNSGLYSTPYIEHRRKMLFSDEEFEGFEAGINRFLGTATISGSENMEGLNLLELIEPDAIFELIFGSSFIQGIMLFLSILGYIR